MDAPSSDRCHSGWRVPVQHERYWLALSFTPQERPLMVPARSHRVDCEGLARMRGLSSAITCCRPGYLSGIDKGVRDHNVSVCVIQGGRGPVMMYASVDHRSTRVRFPCWSRTHFNATNCGFTEVVTFALCEPLLARMVKYTR